MSRRKVVERILEHTLPPQELAALHASAAALRQAAEGLAAA
jgi:hypothetical protein